MFRSDFAQNIEILDFMIMYQACEYVITSSNCHSSLHMFEHANLLGIG